MSLLDFYSLQTYYAQLESKYTQLLSSNDWLDPNSSSYQEAAELNNQIQSTIEQMINTLKQLKDKKLTNMYSTLLKKYNELNDIQLVPMDSSKYDYNITLSNMYYYHSLFWIVLCIILIFFILNILFS
jgi:DNA repair exonuclease SbcCD ATPase subunit